MCFCGLSAEYDGRQVEQKDQSYLDWTFSTFSPVFIGLRYNAHTWGSEHQLVTLPGGEDQRRSSVSHPTLSCPPQLLTPLSALLSLSVPVFRFHLSDRVKFLSFMQRSPPTTFLRVNICWYSLELSQRIHYKIPINITSRLPHWLAPSQGQAPHFLESNNNFLGPSFCAKHVDWETRGVRGVIRLTDRRSFDLTILYIMSGGGYLNIGTLTSCHSSLLLLLFFSLSGIDYQQIYVIIYQQFDDSVKPSSSDLRYQVN